MSATSLEERSRARVLKQLRPLLLFCVLALVVLAIGVTLAARGLMNSFGHVEKDATTQKAEQVYRAFEADLKQLYISNRDYAEWDDAEAFIRDREHNGDFIANNFSVPTLTSMHVDLVWIVDAQGRDIHSGLIDRNKQTATIPAPRSLLEQFRRFQTRERTLRELSPAERIIQTSDGLAAVSAIEISRSDFSNHTGAVMLFARFIRAQEIQRVHETSRLDVTMTGLAGATAGNRSLPGDVKAWLKKSHMPTFVRVVDRDRIAGYSLLRDIDHQPVAVFATEGPREIFALGSRTTWYLLSSIVALFLAFGAIAVGLVLRMLKLQRKSFEQERAAEEQERLNKKKLTKQAQQDALTRLPNRAYLSDRLPRLLKKMAGSEKLLALVSLDIDHFKIVNDSRGHNCGDQILQVTARRLRAAVASHDMVVRLGGDEFVIVAPLMPDIESIGRFAERLQAAVRGDMVIDGRTMTVSASLGIVVCPHDGTDMETLFKCADIALYQAKEAGRNCHRFFDAETGARISEFAELEQALRGALGTNQLRMEYQPIVDLHDGHVVSLEALMRWNHPEMGSISPVRFINVAEKSGLIVELGQIALRKVIAQQRAWLDEGVPIVPIAVNVSPMQLERVDFPALVERLAKEGGVDPKWLRFEITESAMMKEPEKLIGALQKLRDGGSQVLIDDFGTGYSNLSYLDRLPVDILKIDRAFVKDLVRGGEHTPIIDAVIGMAQRLKLRTVAEGVETMDQAMLLNEAGCDYAQGYAYSKPVSALHCKSLLEQLRRERAITHTIVARALTAA